MTQAQKIDLFKEHKDEYATSKSPVLVKTKPARYLTVSGEGEPEGERFQNAVGAIYGVAYTLKFSTKKAGGPDFKVAPLEGLWWVEKGRGNLETAPMSAWSWKLLVRVPDFVADDDLALARKELERKGKGAGAGNVKLETFGEGECVQMLHVGPYDKEPPTLDAMKSFAEEQGMESNGHHHEIYLSDPRRTAPEKVRTILRQPVRRKKR